LVKKFPIYNINPKFVTVFTRILICPWFCVSFCDVLVLNAEELLAIA